MDDDRNQNIKSSCGFFLFIISRINFPDAKLLDSIIKSGTYQRSDLQIQSIPNKSFIQALSNIFPNLGFQSSNKQLDKIKSINSNHWGNQVIMK